MIYFYRFQNEEMNSIISEDKLFDNKFIEEVKNMSTLKDNKEYKKMKLSRIIDSFVENSSIMVANVTAQSYYSMKYWNMILVTIWLCENVNYFNICLHLSQLLNFSWWKDLSVTVLSYKTSEF